MITILTAIKGAYKTRVILGQVETTDQYTRERAIALRNELLRKYPSTEFFIMKHVYEKVTNFPSHCSISTVSGTI